MHNTDCLQLIASLKEEELGEFYYYLLDENINKLNAPLYLIQELYEQYVNWYPLYEEYRNNPQNCDLEQLSGFVGKAYLFSEIFPDRPYNDARIRKTISTTKQLLEQFILQKISTNPHREKFQQHIKLLSYYLDRGEDALYLKAAKKAEKLLQASPEDATTYEFASQLAELQITHDIRTARKKDSFDIWSERFDRYTVLTKLRQFAGMAAREKLLDQQYDYPFLDEIDNYIAQAPTLQTPLILAWQSVLQLNRASRPHASYTRLQFLLATHQAEFHPHECRMLYAAMLNFLVRENRQSNQDHSYAIFDLFQTMVETKAIYIDGNINSTYFSTCVRAAFQVNELAWAEDFIYAHEDRLLGPNPRDLFDYTLLQLLFERKDYSEILKRIDHLTFQDEHKEVLRRMLKLRTLYETEDTERFFRLCDTLRKYIPGKKQLGTTARTHYKNFVRYLEKIGRRRFNQRPLPKGLRAEIQKIQLAERKWLLEKLQELT